MLTELETVLGCAVDVDIGGDSAGCGVDVDRVEDSVGVWSRC